MDVGECNKRRLYTGLRLDYRLRLWAPTSTLRAISAVAKPLVIIMVCFANMVREVGIVFSHSVCLDMCPAQRRNSKSPDVT